MDKRERERERDDLVVKSQSYFCRGPRFGPYIVTHSCDSRSRESSTLFWPLEGTKHAHDARSCVQAKHLYT